MNYREFKPEPKTNIGCTRDLDIYKEASYSQANSQLANVQGCYDNVVSPTLYSSYVLRITKFACILYYITVLIGSLLLETTVVSDYFNRTVTQLIESLILNKFSEIP